MNGPREHRRHPGSDDKTVEVPLRSPGRASAPPEEPWWKNANSRVPPPPPPQSPRPAAWAPPPPQPAQREAPRPRAANRHAKSAPPRRGHLALLAVVGLIALSAGAVGLWWGLTRFGLLTGKVLDVSKAQAGVQRILVDPVDGYGATSVSDVVCNNGDDPEIRKGGTFTCDVIVEGRQRQVLVVFSDNDGTYEVDRPR
ncbi:DUF4333 domain-containing protein [Mycolicibacterium moriokaense]|nr:DUF4333 domain-containing protein [Mycolicibacterium moriokaense]